MAVYCITFEHKYAQKHYINFFAAIKSYGFWYKQLDNVWFIQTDHDAPSIRNYLNQHTYKGDKLFVIKVVKGWAGIGYTKEGYDWLRTHMTDF